MEIYKAESLPEESRVFSESILETTKTEFHKDLKFRWKEKFKLLSTSLQATVRTGYGNNRLVLNWKMSTMLSPWLFNFYAEYIMRNARLDEAQAGIKIAGRNINNLRYADDTTLMVEREELKSLLMKLKDNSEKADLKQHSEN